MIRKSGNRFSEKIMLKQRDETMIRFNLIGSWSSGYHAHPGATCQRMRRFNHRCLFRAARNSALLRDFIFCDNSLEPRDILQKALAGQDQEVIAELRVLKVNLEQLFIGDGEDLGVLRPLTRR